MTTNNLIEELQLAKDNGYIIKAEKLRISEQRVKIIVNITKKKSFADCCKDFYNTHTEIFHNPKIKFFSQDDHTFCIYNNKVYYAKRRRCDFPVPLIGQVAAWARATKTDVNKMVGYVP